MTIDLGTVTPAERQGFLQAAVAPRPICFASTIDRAGQVNLSPFSFFNMFSSTPPVLIFSPSRRVRDNTTKHTWHNVLEVPEVVINIVDYPMVQQVSLSSCDYPREVCEFTKAGFTPEPATLVRPPMVKESKVRIECRVIDTRPLGDQPGAGNLVICEALRMHIDDSIIDPATGRIDQRRFQLVARLGEDWYCEVGPAGLFRVEKPNIHLGIGIDALPPAIRNSRILSGNDLGQLANVHALPTVDPAYDDDRLRQIFQYYAVNPDEMEAELHSYARQLLAGGKVREAWQVLLALN
ncbi:MAG TPA: flavin reductase family protein [Puia sp.]|jgi:flavin reductase (DIM6/NTAB) family NADH-FMN oxidoreductase RutF|nr:flavin reductase family protein [Puia sp.]